jgi:hypothetical protein
MSVVGRIPLHVIFKIVVALNLPQTLMMLICICLFIADSMLWVCHVVSMRMGAEADKPTKRILEQDPASAAQTTAAAPTRPLSSPRGGECLLQPTMPLQSAK